MYCNKCGTANSGAAFCTNCGASLALASQPAQPVVNVVSQSPAQTYANAGYSQPAPQFGYQPTQPYMPPQTNGKAIAALVLSLLGISLLGAIFGHLAQGEIKASQGRQTGDGMAIAGIVLGWLGVFGWTMFWILALASASYLY